jgi:hypothetical protein
VDERDYTKTIGEIREWLVKIDTNQKHQTRLLETINTQASNAFAKADSAEDRAEEALTLAQQTDRRLDDYIENERTGRRWLVGVLVTIALALLPILNSFYL